MKTNKEHILKGMKEKIECSVCKKMVSKCNMNKHKATYKCARKAVHTNKDETVIKILEAVKELLKNEEKDQ